MFAWCYGIKDMFNWFKALWHLDDNQLQAICGTDYTLYLIFLRMSAFLLLCITVFNGIVTIPMFVTGKPMPADDYTKNEKMSSMDRATILNITATKSKMIATFVCAIVIVPFMAFFMIYKFRQKYYMWKKRVDPMEEFKDIDIASFAVEVRNLPIDEGVESLQRKITANMNKLYPPDPITGKNVFIRARVIGDYNYLYKKCVDLKQLVD